MTSLVKKTADEIKIVPVKIRGMESHGNVYLLWEDSHSVGAQCQNCSTIIWHDSRANKILSKVKPNHIPDSGEAYRKYYQNNIAEFLVSQPCCPNCKKSTFDKFINNVNFPRFSDGTQFTESNSLEIINLNPKEIEVWCTDI